MTFPPSPSVRASRLLTLGYLGLSVVDTWLAGSSRPRAHRARWVTKPLLMPTLAASLATRPRAAVSPLRTGTLVAQGCGAVGDVALLVHGSTAFTAGAGSFALGHLGYVAGFAARRDRGSRLRDSPTARLAVRTVLAIGPLMALGAARERPALGPAVLGYSALLGGLLATAGHLDPAMPAPARRCSLAGAALFNLSDTVLAATRFWWRGAPPRVESVVMGTYTAAQLLLSEGAARAR